MRAWIPNDDRDLVLPTGWAILTSSIRSMHSAGNWFDPSTA
jgi:hypothetical protein